MVQVLESWIFKYRRLCRVHDSAEVHDSDQVLSVTIVHTMGAHHKPRAGRRTRRHSVVPSSGGPRGLRIEGSLGYLVSLTVSSS